MIKHNANATGTLGWKEIRASPRGIDAQRVNGPVQPVDVAPTIAAYIGMASHAAAAGSVPIVSISITKSNTCLLENKV